MCDYEEITDNAGGYDTFDTINMDYLFQVAQIQITFQAKLIGLGSAPDQP